ncbi:MAG: large conductance mechanosensitive channel protein MscL [Candidatus Saccharicenans sp.]
MLKGFKAFIMRGNVVDLAVAVIIGAAFNQIVNSMVGDVLTPLIGAIFGRPDFSGIVLGPVLLGKFINAVVNFLIVAATIYFAVVVPMKKIQERLDRKKAAEEAAAPAPAPSEEVRLLSEILETLKSRRA